MDLKRKRFLEYQVSFSSEEEGPQGEGKGAVLSLARPCFYIKYIYVKYIFLKLLNIFLRGR